MSGCAVCVYDLYEESLEAYQNALSSLRTSLTALNIPDYEWPLSVQQKRSKNSTGSRSESEMRKETVLSAFEEMERALALKEWEAFHRDRVSQCILYLYSFVIPILIK
ncbi:hypothetical protein GALMADRAFT_749745 [Galerina marginata CBS 339.88]|uniref:Oxidoreductase-like domain-containing protein n=1 Tax=Galerina marginata (strain CBS 339.88) TaxID=685588 RepID=A0A067SXU6_GALM3|nr:hypothetical protein GALMADRAFT_749745 [Galerina marginata CBS 339.88]